MKIITEFVNFIDQGYQKIVITDQFIRQKGLTTTYLSPTPKSVHGSGMFRSWDIQFFIF